MCGWGEGEVYTCPPAVNSGYKLPLQINLRSKIMVLEPIIITIFNRKKNILFIHSGFTHLQMRGKRKNWPMRSLKFFLVLRYYENKIPVSVV